MDRSLGLSVEGRGSRVRGRGSKFKVQGSKFKVKDDVSCNGVDLCFR